MPQRFGLDHRIFAFYFGLLAMACRAGPEPVAPVDLEPVSREQVADWVSATQAQESRLDRFKWLFRDERASAGGRGSARIVPPDSLRFDVAGPFGSGAASAVVVDNRAVWTDPPDAIAKLVPNYPLMWAMFGMAMMPAGEMELHGLSRDSMKVWRYAGGSDTIYYVQRVGDPLRFTAEVRQRGELLGRAEATLKPDRTPLKARLTVPSAPARLDLTFLSTTRDTFASEIWLPRKP